MENKVLKGFIAKDRDALRKIVDLKCEFMNNDTKSDWESLTVKKMISITTRMKFAVYQYGNENNFVLIGDMDTDKQRVTHYIRQK